MTNHDQSKQFFVGGVFLAVILGVPLMLAAIVYAPAAFWWFLGGLLVWWIVVDAMASMNDPDVRRRTQIVGTVALGLGGLCMGSVFVMSQLFLGVMADGRADPMGETVGPVSIEEGHTWIRMRVQQSIEPRQQRIYTEFQRWSFVTVELLDGNKEYLTSLGGEHWHYGGSSWREQDDAYEATLLVPSAGTYYLRFKTEANVQASELSAIQFTVSEILGGSRLLQWLAHLSFFVGALAVVVPATRTK